MTFSEFVLAAEQIPAPTEWRRGQNLFNGLSIVRPDLANMIRDTDANPFYDDTRIGQFWAFVQSHWSDREVDE